VTASVVVVHATDEPPQQWSASLFLAGPTPRTADVASWRPQAIAELERRWRGPGVLAVFWPEPYGQVWSEYDSQRTWELHWGDHCDVVLFWIPRGPGMPALTTNDEWGHWKDSGRVVLGTPPDATSVRYQRSYAADHGVPVSDTLSDTVGAALTAIGTGAVRSGPHREVPLLLWREPSFQSWLADIEGAGNTLRDSRVEWTFRVDGRVVFWALHPVLAVAAEDRVKSNEVVVSRPDIATVLAYRPAPSPLDTEIVLVREFRAPGGLVLDLPGGSDPAMTDPARLAATELAEETGLDVAVDRLVPHGARRLAATVTAHRQHLYSVVLTEAELAAVRATGPLAGTDSELTHPCVLTLRELLTTPHADRTTLGAITEVLLTR
jgi:8-oxo-dGTP pyrophosphatase MutT (NUDIX family)